MMLADCIEVIVIITSMADCDVALLFDVDLTFTIGSTPLEDQVVSSLLDLVLLIAYRRLCRVGYSLWSYPSKKSTL